MSASPMVFTPGLEAADPLANYWLRQAMLRLRREVCWLWQERGGKPESGVTPPLVERVAESLNRVRFFEEKQRFWETDPAARYLTCQMDETPPDPPGGSRQGSFTWMVEECGLDSMFCFSFGLALLASVDSAAGPVIATCQNDGNRTLPTIALVQKLWDRPDEALELADPTHPLFLYGLLRRAEANAPDWDAALHTPELVARKLLFPDTTRALQLEPVGDNAGTFDQFDDAAYQTALLLRAPAQNLRIVTLLARAETSARALVSTSMQPSNLGQRITACGHMSRRNCRRSLGPNSRPIWIGKGLPAIRWGAPRRGTWASRTRACGPA